MNVETIILLLAISVTSIMQAYYFEPWQAVKQKLKINKVPILGTILDCAVCFTFWSTIIILKYYSFSWLLSIQLALINTIVTTILQEKFIKF